MFRIILTILTLVTLTLPVAARDNGATRRCLDRALTRWGNRRGPCGNGSSMRSWVRVALSGGVLPAFLPAAGLPCPPSSYKHKLAGRSASTHERVSIPDVKARLTRRAFRLGGRRCGNHEDRGDSIGNRLNC